MYCLFKFFCQFGFQKNTPNMNQLVRHVSPARLQCLTPMLNTKEIQYFTMRPKFAIIYLPTKWEIPMSSFLWDLAKIWINQAEGTLCILSTPAVFWTITVYCRSAIMLVSPSQCVFAYVWLLAPTQRIQGTTGLYFPVGGRRETSVFLYIECFSCIASKALSSFANIFIIIYFDS